MRLSEPYPDITHLMHLIGEAGSRLAEIEASEGAAGNISIYIGWELEPLSVFSIVEPIDLPTTAPELEGYGFLVTGSGRRLREIANDPEANLCYIRVNGGGKKAELYSSPRRLFQRPTSEFNSHVAVHRDQIIHRDLNFHSIIHAQPLHLVYLSHIPRYQETFALSRRLLRWQPETIVNIPQGIGYLPFMLPGSPELMMGNVRMMRDHHLVLWSKHGVMARSDLSVKRASDLIEYAESAARYEFLNLSNHELADGLTHHEIRQICDTFDVEQKLF